MIRSTLRVLTTFLSFLLIGNPVPANPCQPVSTAYEGPQPQRMDCCQPAQCHCDLSAPSQPLPNSLPLRATSVDGHQLTNFASLPTSAILPVSSEHFSLHSNVGFNSRQSAVPFFVLTHAFLI